MHELETYTFDGDGRFPNSRLPIVVYRNALPTDASAMMNAFAANSWSNAWTDGIFSYHHFHSIAHEVLSIAAGEVKLAFGGPSGRTLALKAGDDVIIPAGVAHRNVGQTDGLVVVGADWDLRRGDPDEYENAKAAAELVSPLVTDPVCGGHSSLHKLWSD